MSRSWFTRVLKAAWGAREQQGQDFIVRQLKAPQGVVDTPQILRKDEQYVSVVVRSSRIVNVRKWVGKFYGAVHARSHYLHQDRGLVEYQTVISPKLMQELDPAHLERVITIDKPILGPVPYIGQLSLELGLFSVKGSDLAGPYIDVLTSLADAAGVGFFSKALPFVDPLRKGLDLLFGDNNQAELEIGLDQSWNEVKTGTWLVIRAPKGTKAIEDLQLDPDDLGLIDAHGQAYRDQPYIVFAIQANERRDDWMTIPELKTAWDKIGEAAKEGEINKAEKLFDNFQIIARWSPDLVPKDAERLAQKAKALLPQLVKDTAIGLTKQTAHPLGEFGSLDLYNATRPSAG